MFPEGAEGHGREFETLAAVGDADDADAPEGAGQDPAETAEEAAKDEPDEVT